MSKRLFLRTTEPVLRLGRPGHGAVDAVLLTPESDGLSIAGIACDGSRVVATLVTGAVALSGPGMTICGGRRLEDAAGFEVVVGKVELCS